MVAEDIVEWWNFLCFLFPYYTASIFLCYFCILMSYILEYESTLCVLSCIVFYFLTVLWSCQFIARASKVSLQRWQMMGGMIINTDILIDKSIRKSINSRSSVLKVSDWEHVQR